MSPAGRGDRTRQTTALVALLKALPDAQLDDVLVGVGASRDVPSTGPRHRGKPCTECGLIYPQHEARQARVRPEDRHDFKAAP